MSECVVRMEMPKNCLECPFSIIDDTADGAWCTFCNALANIVYGYVERDVDCPIIFCQLPEGHGELIERQAVYEKIKWWQENTHDKVTKVMLHEFYLMLYGVPAIVPADTAERSET